MSGPFSLSLKILKMIHSRSKTWIRCLLLAALGGLLQSPAVAGDVAAGKAKARLACQNCHGMDGVALIPGAATLSGQPREYLVAQLRAFRAGSRKEAQMNVVAKPLTDAEIENLASWYAAIKFTVEMPE